MDDGAAQFARSIDEARDAGVIDAETADSLKRFNVDKSSRPNDVERLRVFSGFNDFFVVVASVISMVAAFSIGMTMAAGVGPLMAAVIAWLVLEVFVKKRRLPLVGVVVAVAFSGFLFAAVSTLLEAGDAPEWLVVVAAAVITATASYAAWRRFAVPISVATVVAASLVPPVVMGVAAFESSGGINAIWLIFVAAGMAVFCYAMRWDAADRSRTTYKADVAFWLHILAASLVVHSVFTWLTSLLETNEILWISLVVALYGLLACISIIIDRRALMASALIYLLIAAAQVFSDSGAVKSGFAVVALLVGLKLLLLSVYWIPVRRVVLRLVPPRIRDLVPLAT
ncbi:MAG: hypothetical protein EAZ30_06920 [Betaproteobacteria bacterium]|nr:MAG: hypothetical protein EAZ30_06920 [Betaproteobacteria bacterium]